MKKQLILACLMLLACLVKAQPLQTNPPVHDPVMFRQDSTYYVYCTGRGISVWSSTDRVHWKHEAPVFAQAPQWTSNAIPGFKNFMWAPDISYYKGLYYLYYAVSVFGKNTSCIGLATSKTLHTNDTAYHWTDRGLIIQSFPGKTNWNAIDPNLITDKDGTPYLFFGSFWDGLKVARLSKDRMHIDDDLNNLPTVASRKTAPGASLPAVDDNPPDAGGNAIEAPFVFRKGNYFYLFASIDYCCKGPKSTYKMIVGRSTRIKGPYVDKNNIPMAKGGGSLVLAGDSNWYGVGHNAVCTFDGTDYLIFHGYDAADNGRSKLRVEKLDWDAQGWPFVVK